MQEEPYNYQKYIIAFFILFLNFADLLVLLLWQLVV